jgi:hypothetical protein
VSLDGAGGETILSSSNCDASCGATIHQGRSLCKTCTGLV